MILDAYIRHKENASATAAALRVGGSDYPTRKQVGDAVLRMRGGSSAAAAADIVAASAAVVAVAAAVAAAAAAADAFSSCFC